MERNATAKITIFSYNIDERKKYFSEEEWKIINEVFSLTGPYTITYYNNSDNSYTIHIDYIGPKTDDLSGIYVYYYFSDMNFQSSIEYDSQSNNVFEKIDNQWLFCARKKILK